MFFRVFPRFHAALHAFKVDAIRLCGLRIQGLAVYKGQCPKHSLHRGLGILLSSGP